jgi:hypothetical protein
VSYVLEQGQACAACGRVLASSGGVTTWLAPERKARRRRDRRSGRIAADLFLLIPTLQVALLGGLACGPWGSLVCVLSWSAGLLVGAIVRGGAIPRARAGASACHEHNHEAALQLLEEARARIAALEAVLEEIAHHPEYDGSLCHDREDCPNCYARAALDAEARGDGHDFVEPKP